MDSTEANVATFPCATLAPGNEAEANVASFSCVTIAPGNEAEANAASHVPMRYPSAWERD